MGQMSAEYKREWYLANKARTSAAQKARYAANIEREREKRREYERRNKDAAKLRHSKWYSANRERANADSRARRKANPPCPVKELAKVRRRQAATLQRLPKWADLDEIEAIYRKARAVTSATGVQHHVDHVVPLRGKTVSGLHVAHNLRIITAEDNLRKGRSHG